MKNLQISWIVLITLLMTSCVSKQKMVYFGDKESLQVDAVLQEYETTIQKDDMLTINVSATNSEAVLPFNIYETPVMGNSLANIEPLPYLVNAKGEINFPILGSLKVEGMTNNQLSVYLIDKLKEYLSDPIVTIRTTNFKVTVLGEVNKPGAFTIPNQRITVLEAIGLAGDLTIKGNRKNITLVREINGKRTLIPIDLTNRELFNAPYFYLAQNDVIYVEPNKAQINSSVVGANTSVIFSAISSLLSIIAILF
ncbi:polysaccharide biosynthesis/export family protein [Polaribacter sargassicola]|uniref:polysaccharide biosynthesis/export family protein n=1 Tax=Polaribacter sargassicola TaxID=2836891 RepID=UPI001F02501E|nr:polysaccharide biosynthesis/export family protein [Polaribacter sp. DS7-9]MCG1037466.1 polysaccharide biosynthesis/export family protein [Polaribacter sp. DS7-9]